MSDRDRRLAVNRIALYADPVMPDSPLALLIHPPVYDFAFYDLFARPYGLMKIGRWLVESGWDVRFVNALDYRDTSSCSLRGMPSRRDDGTGKLWRMSLPPTRYSQKIRRKYCRYGVLPEALENNLRNAVPRQPDLVCIGTGMTYWYEGVRETVERCRRIFPGVPVVAGGVYASLLPDHCRKVSGVDFAVEGEAWPAFPGFLGMLRLPAPAEPPGETVLPLNEAWRDGGVIRLNRGCPYRCEYCASRKLSPEFVPGSVDAAFQHILDLFTRCGTKNFAFFDDALLADSKRILVPFLERIIESRLDVRFYLPNAVHVKLLEPGTAELMKRAGFREVRMGFESSSEDFHERYGSKFDEEDFFTAVENLRLAGFDAGSLSVYILAGLPGQRAEEVEASVRYASRAGVNVRIAEYSPVPGTALWNESVTLCAFPLEEEPLYHNNTFFPLEWDGFTREDLDRIKRLAKALSVSPAPDREF